jgi:hypothetical protein
MQVEMHTRQRETEGLIGRERKRWTASTAMTASG